MTATQIHIASNDTHSSKCIKRCHRQRLDTHWLAGAHLESQMLIKDMIEDLDVAMDFGAILKLTNRVRVDWSCCFADFWAVVIWTWHAAAVVTRQIAILMR